MLPETEELLRSAKKEITRLRRDNKILRAKCDTMEIFAAALGLKEIDQGMGEDLVWRIGKALQNAIKEQVEVPEGLKRPLHTDGHGDVDLATLRHRMDEAALKHKSTALKHNATIPQEKEER